jgi:hypothetical protein
MIHKKLPENYFTLRKSTGIIIPPEDLELTCDMDSTIYELRYKGDMEVDHYLDKKSILRFYYPSVNIDRNGNILSDLYSIETSGYWAKHRIADILPKNYNLELNANDISY